MVGLNVRRLAALDMTFLGTQVIVAEYAAGVVLPWVIAALSVRRGVLPLGIPLPWIGLNNVPLFVHAVDLARRGTAREEVAAELADPPQARSYSWRQLWILVPLGVVVFALLQRRR
ncbi:MAG TPA: hypothetical protein VGX27_12855 [Candidatus Dormibacteraeota bacterium]|nr:hypothetical protein [Candidatus Dormibacteraeota bacterium]